MTYDIEWYQPGESYVENDRDYVTAGTWREALYLKLPGPTLTEAERAAAVRSENGLVYRVRDGKKILSRFQHGKQLTKEDA